MSAYDLVIVGAGTAGCVLAERASADPTRSVLLCEAGPDFPAGALPPALASGDAAGFDWRHTAALPGGRSGPLARGRVVGGSMQVNASGAVRALAADYRAWAGLGLPTWSWDRVLGAYRRAENDQDFGDRHWHGDSGPIPIVRPTEAGLSAPMTAFATSALDHGHSWVEDLNAPDAVGMGLYPHNVFPDGSRASTARCYLDPARGRENLTIRADLVVDRVLLEDGTATGVQAGRERIQARSVLLAAGCPGSPTLLLRSGIGPAEELRAAGIDPIVDLPGVGRGVYDQPGAVVPARPRPGVLGQGSVRPQLFGRGRAIPGHAQDDGLYLTLFTGPEPGGTVPMIALMVGDLNPASRGAITLTSADPREPPAIDLGFYTAPGDLGRMRDAYRHAWNVATHPAMRAIVAEYEMDDDLIADDRALAEVLTAMTFSRLALAGGARMAAPGDPGGVVDAACRVNGVERLQVVDLSIAPVPLRGPTAMDAVAIAEHALAEGFV